MEFWSGIPPGQHFHMGPETRSLCSMSAFSFITIKATVMYFNKHYKIFYVKRKSGSLLYMDLSLLSSYSG